MHVPMPRTASRHCQRGLTLVGLVFIAVIAVVVIAIGGQSLPVFLERQAVQKAALRAANEGTTVSEVRAIFDRAATVERIRSLRGSDLEISKVNDRVVVAYTYSREIPLVGPAYLVYRFKDQTR